MAMVVECVGVAGAGKSHSSALLVEELEALGTRAAQSMALIGPNVPRWRRVARKIGYGLGEVVRGPRPVLNMVRAVVRSGQQQPRDAGALVLNWIALRALVRRTRKTTTVGVFDQAALMALWSTALRGDDTACRLELAQPSWSWVLPDAVVRVRAPAELTINQLQSRGARQSRLEVLDDDALVEGLATADDEIDRIVRWWHETSRDGGGAFVAELTNPGDSELDAAARDVASALACCATSVGGMTEWPANAGGGGQKRCATKQAVSFGISELPFGREARR
jgi:hypothetical protein